MFYISALLLIFVSSSYSINYEENCEDVRSVDIYYQNTHNVYSHINISGCLEPQTFMNDTPESFEINKQNITKLGKNYVRDLIRLKKLKINNCPLESIDSGALRNLPSLYRIDISENPKLTVIRKEVFDGLDDLRELVCTKNSIEKIENGALSNSNLEIVDFTSNNLTKLEPNWFGSFSFVKTLSFDSNNIEKIPRRAFDSMDKLNYVSFAGNKISEIGDGAFGNTRLLQKLILSDNLLHTININIFPVFSNLHLYILKLDKNLLNFISVEVLKKINPTFLYIDYNPFVCSCYTDLYQYCNNNTVTLQKTDGCSINFLPYCISSNDICKTDKDELKSYEVLTGKYLDVIKQLPNKYKTCAYLKKYINNSLKVNNK